jgi:hypothetical protein
VEGLECRSMAKSPKGIVLNHEEIAVQVGTRMITGTYSVLAGMITVSTPWGTRLLKSENLDRRARCKGWRRRCCARWRSKGRPDGREQTLEDAKAAFKAACLKWAGSAHQHNALSGTCYPFDGASAYQAPCVVRRNPGMPLPGFLLVPLGAYRPSSGPSVPIQFSRRRPNPPEFDRSGTATFKSAYGGSGARPLASPRPASVLK